MEFKDLVKINKQIESIDFKGKEYVEVNKRVLAFRELLTNGSIETEIVHVDGDTVIIKATIRDTEGNILATGLAEETKNSSFINKTSFVENCETSAVGRALGFLGIGIDTSIASKEEVETAVAKTKENLLQQVNLKYTTVELAELMNCEEEEVKEKLERQTIKTLQSLKERR